MPDAPLREVSLNVTAKCAGRCVYCPVPACAPPADPPQESLAGIVTQAAALGARRLCLTGGEPFTAPALTALLAAARAHDLDVVVCTSGAGVTRESIARAVQAAGRARALQVCLSLDTIDEAVAARLGRPAVSVALSALEALTATGWPVIPSVNLVLTRVNAAGASEVAALCGRRGVGFGVQLLSERLPGGRRVPEGLAISPDDPLVCSLTDDLESLSRHGLRVTNSPSYLAAASARAERRACASHTDRLCVDVDLRAHTCWLLPPIGALGDQTVAAVWRSPAAAQSRAMMLSGSCPECTLRCFHDGDAP